MAPGSATWDHKVEKAFKSVAKNAKLGIPIGKLRWVLKNMGTGLSDDDINAVFSEIDDDNNGFVNLEEFIEWVQLDEKLSAVLVESLAGEAVSPTRIAAAAENRKPISVSPPASAGGTRGGPNGRRPSKENFAPPADVSEKVKKLCLDNCSVEIALEDHVFTAADAKYIADRLRAGTKEMGIKVVKLTSVQMDGAPLREFARGVAQAAALRSLFVDTVELPRERLLWEGKETAGEFRADNRITKMDWTGIGFDVSNGDDILCTCLAECLRDARCKLEELYLHTKQLGVEAGYALGEGVRLGSSLKRLRLAAPIPVEGLKNNTDKDVDFMQKGIYSPDVIVLAELLKQNTSVKALRLSDNKVDFFGGEALFRALTTNKTISALDFSGNDLGDDAMKPLADMLETNKTLKTLVLRGVGMSDGGAKVLAEALPKNFTLQTLHLQSNRIGDLGFKQLLEAVEKNKGLKEVKLSENCVSQVVKEQSSVDTSRVTI